MGLVKAIVLRMHVHPIVVILGYEFIRVKCKRWKTTDRDIESGKRYLSRTNCRQLFYLGTHLDNGYLKFMILFIQNN